MQPGNTSIFLYHFTVKTASELRLTLVRTMRVFNPGVPPQNLHPKSVLPKYIFLWKQVKVVTSYFLASIWLTNLQSRSLI